VGNKKTQRKLARKVINGKLSVTEAKAKLSLAAARRQKKKATAVKSALITKGQTSQRMAADIMTGMLQSDDPATREMASRYLEVKRVTSNPDYWRQKAEKLEMEQKRLPRQDSLAS
jgi:hypothetical protein